ncbi:MAG: DMT family transporter [Acidimicrobiales bacterium]|nr:DMT family transporter [Acidimicrobiales bacterium]
MAAVLALLSSALFGAGDFLGGSAAKKTHVLVVVAVSHVVGLMLILSIAPWMADSVTIRDLGIGLGAGVFGVIGISCLYHCLSRGPMAVVAPVAAVSNAAIPVLWGICFGERLSPLQVVGVLFGLVAIALISRGARNEVGARLATWGLLGEALLSGAGFAGFFILMDMTTEATAPWPLVSSRIISAGLAILLLAQQGRAPIPRRNEGLLLIVGCGVLDMTANLSLLMAVHHGMLSLVAVLGTLYPASTVLLARYFLQEKMAPSQIGGLFVALAAIAAIVSG